MVAKHTSGLGSVRLNTEYIQITETECIAGMRFFTHNKETAKRGNL